MRVVLRADASVRRGSGHMMRSLTLGEALTAAGHEVIVAGAVEDVPFVAAQLTASGHRVVGVEADALGAQEILALDPDWVVVDSYWIEPAPIAELDSHVPVLAIVDSNTRGIQASLYLDHNLGAEALDRPVPAGSMLAGSLYSLVRDAVLAQRRPLDPSPELPHLVVFMGGTDPDGVIVRVAEQVAAIDRQVRVTAIAPALLVETVQETLGPAATVLATTPDLPRILGTADAVVSASGTSAWDVCTLGIPSVFVGIVDNQSEGIAQIRAHEVGFGLDLHAGDPIGTLPALVGELVGDPVVRARFASHCAALFDGEGKHRVVRELEQRARLDRS